MALAATFTCVLGYRGWRAFTLAAAAIPIAVLTNAARVAGTGILAHHYGPQVAEGFFHTVSG
jgi:exosortase/archaeosortase family protein